VIDLPQPRVARPEVRAQATKAPARLNPSEPLSTKSNRLAEADMSTCLSAGTQL